MLHFTTKQCSFLGILPVRRKITGLVYGLQGYFLFFNHSTIQITSITATVIASPGRHLCNLSVCVCVCAYASVCTLTFWNVCKVPSRCEFHPPPHSPPPPLPPSPPFLFLWQNPRPFLQHRTWLAPSLSGAPVSLNNAMFCPTD